MGAEAGRMSSGDGNNFFGRYVGRDTTGSYNIFMGYNTMQNTFSGSGNIVLGNSLDLPSASVSNMLDIGNLLFATGMDGTGSTLSSGKVGIGTTSPASKLSVVGSTYLAGSLYASSTVQFSNFGAGTLQTDANGNLSVSSDERLKNIRGNLS